jgi:hypothetical protein
MAESYNAEDAPMRREQLPKILITAVALVALSLFVVLRVDIQAGVLALVLIAVLPWLASSIEHIQLPGGVSVRLREVQQKVADQERKIDAQREIIEQLVVYSMSWYIFTMLAQLYHRNTTGQEYLYRDGDMARDLRFLRDHGYLEHFNIAGLHDGENLVEKVRLTPIGNFLVELREQMQARQARQSADHLRNGRAT